MTERWSRLEALLRESVDLAWLAAFRVLFGLTMMVSMLRFIAYGWVDTFFGAPAFHFKYWGFSWVTPLPLPLTYGLFWLLAVLAACMALGLWFRLTSALFVLGFSYLQLIDVTTYLNHYYLASLLGSLLVCSPAHRMASLDALLAPACRRRDAPRAWLLLLRFQVALVYVFAGFAKAHGDWLIHAQPLRIWLAARTDTPLIGPLLTYSATPLVMSWAGFLFDTSVPFFLLWRRTRLVAYLVEVAFHVTTRVLFPIGMFPVIMILAALVFFPPDWPRRLLSSHLPRARGPRASCVPLPRFGRVRLALASAYCAVQLLLPLRFLVYGGDVRWHEQGMRFSWRVMVREKNGSVTFRVRSKQTGRAWEVNPTQHLTPLQAREMAGQPDLILQFAQHLRRKFAREGRGDVEVFAEALVSLNGRPMAPLIDPGVDLAALTDSVLPAAWILPEPRTPPPHLRAI